MIRGIDVSKWQGNINFQKVKDSGISFVIIRAGYGKLPSQKDKCFEENYCKAKASGLDVGVYWYSYAMSVDEAREEAKACLSVIKGKQFEFPVYFDLEEQKQFSKGRTFSAPPNQNTQGILIWRSRNSFQKAELFVTAL